ncbi:A/G-specific adenine glycosylase [Heliobacterium chlorum]|uniref:Adenine DNA glycosylase n=1 Tax=Heliobacterium chlorum TaxID=2698 RepID=A0ABR7T375_HELCL|nr:A/G-specific adenine glycosylase [Heliobacterium chlorum]
MLTISSKIHDSILNSTSHSKLHHDDKIYAVPEKDWVLKLLSWYDVNKRDLPWRRSKNPYAIWVSEVMLQQTRVETVIPYFERFMSLFPDLQTLATAPEEPVLKAWEGLGYYSRVRNLQEAARQVMERFDGQVPPDPKAFRSLKGVGAYICGAVLSIVFQIREPAVDGNVCRVFARFFGWDDPVGSTMLLKKAWQASMEQLAWLPDERVPDWTQGLMELGALVCIPRSARCGECPLADGCTARAQGKVEILPVRKPRKENQEIYRKALLLTDESGRVLLTQRPDKGLLANMWELPSFEQGFYDLEHVKYEPERSEQFRHVFSHLTWVVDVMPARIDGEKINPLEGSGRVAEESCQYGSDSGQRSWCDKEALSRLPMNNLTLKILKKYGVL